MSKTTIAIGVTVGVVGTIAAVKYRKELKKAAEGIADKAAEFFMKRKEQVVEVSVAVEEAPVAKAPVNEVVSVAVEETVPAVIETPVTEETVIVEAMAAVEAVNDVVVDVMASRDEMTEETVVAVVAAADDAAVKVEELEKALVEDTKTPEEIAAATTAAMLAMAGAIGKELADEEADKVRLVTESKVMVSPELAVKLEKAMNALPTQPYKQQHNRRHNQRR